MAPMKPPARHGVEELAGTLSLAQLARRWQTSAKQIRHLLAQQQLPFVQIRGQFRVGIADVERYEREHPDR